MLPPTCKVLPTTMDPPETTDVAEVLFVPAIHSMVSLLFLPLLCAH